MPAGACAVVEHAASPNSAALPCKQFNWFHIPISIDAFYAPHPQRIYFYVRACQLPGLANPSISLGCPG